MKTSIKLILAFLLTLCSLQVQGQLTNDQLAGFWQGELMGIRLVFNLSWTEELSLKATLDSPDQGAMAIPMGEVSLKEDSIRMEAPTLNVFYIGRIVSDSIMEGEWHQAGRVFKLDLEKKDEAIVLNRPQEPQPPYPYKEENVSFSNTEHGFTLGGTLTLPDGEGPFPAAILVSGSGSQNRNEEIFGHKPFKVIADFLTRKGISVLRYDDRGVGASGGNAADANTADLAMDTRSAFDYLLKRSEIDPSKIGIIGHSEGGMIAFMLASSHKDIAYIVSLAGPGVDGKAILLDQSERIASLSGASDAILKDNRVVMSGVYDIMIRNETYKAWKEETLEFTSKYYSEKLVGSYSEEEIERGKRNLLASIPEAAYDWMRYFVMFDPTPLFPDIECPVLALNGERDCQVLAEPNINAIKTGLLNGGNANSETWILPGLNHLFQNCETGLLNEYGVIEETFDPETLKIISDWILQQVD